MNAEDFKIMPIYHLLLKEKEKKEKIFRDRFKPTEPKYTHMQTYIHTDRQTTSICGVRCILTHIKPTQYP